MKAALKEVRRTFCRNNFTKPSLDLSKTNSTTEGNPIFVDGTFSETCFLVASKCELSSLASKFALLECPSLISFKQKGKKVLVPFYDELFPTSVSADLRKILRVVLSVNTVHPETVPCICGYHRHNNFILRIADLKYEDLNKCFYITI